MTLSASGLDRRDFLRTSAAGGFSLGGLLGLGVDLRAAQTELAHLKIAGARECPASVPIAPLAAAKS